MTSSDGDQEDLEREVEQLREKVQELEQTGATRRTRPRWGRGLIAVVLLVLACLLAPVAVTAVWANRLISDTNRYVQTVSPLAEDPAMQAAITDRVTTAIFTRVDVQQLANQAITALGQNGPLGGKLANQLLTFTGPLSDGVESFVHTEVAKVVASPAFDAAWDTANRLAHEQFVAVLTGKGTDSVSVKDGTVSLSLAPFVDAVKAQLVSNGFGIASNIPSINTQIVLFKSDGIVKAQRGFRLMNTLAVVLPLLVLLLLIGGVLVAPSRRKGFIGAGVAVAVAMLIGLLSLVIGRHFYLIGIPSTALPQNAAADTFDTVTRFLRQGFRVLFLFGVIAVITALIAGPSRGAVAIRSHWVGGLARANRGLHSIGGRTEPVAPWVEKNQLLLRVLLVIAAVAVLLIWSYPTGKVAFWITVLVVIGLAVVDFLRAPAIEGAPVHERV